MDLQFVTSATPYDVHQMVLITNNCLSHNIFSLSVRFVCGLCVVRRRENLLPYDLLTFPHQLNHKRALLVSPTLIVPPEGEVDFTRRPRHLSGTVEVVLGIRVLPLVEVGVVQPQ